MFAGVTKKIKLIFNDRLHNIMTMEAMVLYEHGGPEVLTLTSMEKPKLCAGHVRIKVKAAREYCLDNNDTLSVGKEIDRSP